MNARARSPHTAFGEANLEPVERRDAGNLRDGERLRTHTCSLDKQMVLGGGVCTLIQAFWNKARCPWNYVESIVLILPDHTIHANIVVVGAKAESFIEWHRLLDREQAKECLVRRMALHPLNKRSEDLVPNSQALP